MKEYEFELMFSLPDASENPEIHIEALGEHGCTDALVGIGQKGKMGLSFIRAAESALDAMTSAISDVRKAIPGAVLVEASPDLVGLTDVAEIFGFSRQYMRELVNDNDEFPMPVHIGKPSIWHLSSILNWAESKKPGKYRFDRNLFEVSSVTRQLNILREARELKPEVRKAMEPLFA